MRGRAARCALAAAAALAFAAASAAQTPDAPAVPGAVALPADSLAADSLAADSLAARGVGPIEAPPGRPVTPVPAVTSALGPLGLLGETPGAFVYALGAPGRWGGVALDGFGPSAPALALDGRPLDDLFDGRPRVDLLPVEAAGPLHLADLRFGRPLAVEVGLRPFRLGRPVTELRYLTGQEGIQVVSATHAQTRRPPRLLRGSGDAARLTTTVHVASRSASGLLAGIALRHSHALGRLLLTRPGLSVEAGAVYVDRSEGARRGASSSIETLFDPGVAAPVGAGALRRTVRTETWATVRFRLGGEPITVGAAWTGQRQRNTTASALDTLGLGGQRAAARLDAPLALGAHRLRLRVEAALEPAVEVRAGGAVLAALGARPSLHAAMLDSLRLGPVRLAVEVGAHRVGGEAFASGAARAERGALFASVRSGRAVAGRIGEVGVPDRGLAAAPDLGEEGATHAAEAGWGTRVGAFRLGLRATARHTAAPRLLVARGDSSFQTVTAPGGFGWAGGTVEAGWREAVPRGLYGRVRATVGGPLTRPGPADADGLHARQSGALPRAWGQARLGVRAEDLGDAVLDLDLAIVVSAWSAFRGRVVEPVTGALALPEPGSTFGYRLPARGTLGAEATATFSARASLFLTYENALARRLYDGAVVVPGEPIPAGVLRFGVFWALLD